VSRAFVKEPDGSEAFEELPDRPISPHPNLVTAEGLAQIERELARAQQEHAEAQAANDRSALARATRDVRYWSSRRVTAQLVPAQASADQVQFGTTVRLQRADGRVQSFRIVGEDEADPARGTVSHVSPLARALFGKSTGDVVEIGGAEAEILGLA
jgi:transcription elongation GreA/GreB family factor